jgi:OOP family OmpA-OmpF porin
MKQLKFFVLAGFMAVLASGCSTLDTNGVGAMIESVGGMQTTRDAFKAGLHKEYVELAKAEYAEGDVADAEFFIKKAKDAGLGLDVAPQAMAERNIPALAKKDMAKARADLVAKLWNGADELTPGPASRAQAMFDCWMQEQEENNQPDHIRACRQSFTAAMADMKVRAKAAAKPVMKPAPKKAMPAPYVVYFGFDSAEISEREMVKVKQAYADFILRKPSKLLVAGHTDTSGNNEYNLGLSRYRSAEVANRLMELGVPRASVQMSRHGEVAPVVETGNNKREAKNRRVTITFIR